MCCGRCSSNPFPVCKCPYNFESLGVSKDAFADVSVQPKGPYIWTDMNKGQLMWTRVQTMTLHMTHTETQHSTNRTTWASAFYIMEYIQHSRFKIGLCPQLLSGLFSLFQYIQQSYWGSSIVEVGEIPVCAPTGAFVDHGTVRGTAPSFSWIFSPSLHYWHYILQNTAGCSEPVEVFWRFLQCFWERKEIHNWRESCLGRLGECTYTKTINDHTSWQSNSWKSLNITHWWYGAVCEDLTVEFSISFMHLQLPALHCSGLTCSILVDLWPEQTAHFVWHVNISPS